MSACDCPGVIVLGRLSGGNCPGVIVRGMIVLGAVTFLKVVLEMFLNVSIHVCLVTVDGFW